MSSTDNDYLRRILIALAGGAGGGAGANPLPDGVFGGQILVMSSGTALDSQVLKAGVTVRMDPAIPSMVTDRVWVGGPGVGVNGYILTAGDSVFIPVNNSGLVHLSTNAGYSGILVYWVAS